MKTIAAVVRCTSWRSVSLRVAVQYVRPVRTLEAPWSQRLADAVQLRQILGLSPEARKAITDLIAVTARDEARRRGAPREDGWTICRQVSYP
jgi:hypothetical protein